MLCKKCGGEVDLVYKICSNCGKESTTGKFDNDFDNDPAIRNDSSLLSFLCGSYHTFVVISFWINIIGCLVGSYKIYGLMCNLTNDNVGLALLITVFVTAVSLLLIILGYGLIAVFLNVEKGIGNLNEKIDGLDTNIRNIGKINITMKNSLNEINAGINKSVLGDSK